MSDQRMDLHVFLIVLFLSSLFLGHNGVEGGKELSEEEDLELEKQLKHMNKPAIKNITTEYGDIYDCVDFYKQPAFDHPLLKNHSFHFQMKPTSIPTGTRDKVSSKDRKSLQIGLKGGGCPVGTVPIRRITKEDLIRERLASRTTPLADNTPGAHYAVVRTKLGVGKYNGAGAIVSLHKPIVTGRQYSAARLKLENGKDSLQVGWRVDPSLYGDARTRLFIRTDAGQSHCFNTRCPGFVIVRSDLPLDLAFPVVSQHGGPFTVIELYIIRDIANGNWWLLTGEVRIGFWPSRLVGGLANLASSAEWGGEVFGPPGTPTPAMGSGASLQRDTKFDAFFSTIEVINGVGKNVDAENTETFADKSPTYDVNDIRRGGALRHLVIYGGRSSRA